MIALNLNTQLSYAELKIVNEKKEDVTNVTQVTNHKTDHYDAYHPPLLDKTSIMYLQEKINVDIIAASIKQDHLLESLKGKDDLIYRSSKFAFSNGCSSMQRFAKIVERNQNNEIISQNDWNTIKSSTSGFENGMQKYSRDKASSNDPEVHKILDALKPYTQKRLDTLRQYLSIKIKAPENVEFKDQKMISSLTIDAQKDKTDNYTKSLLDFLRSDLKWYEWCLNGAIDISEIYYYKEVRSIQVITKLLV
jgi:hypothetical protein